MRPVQDSCKKIDSIAELVYSVCPNSYLSILAIPLQEKKMKKFRDKTVIVTGGASGIGRAICENIARHGAIVTVADINLDGANAACAVQTIAYLAPSRFCFRSS